MEEGGVVHEPVEVLPLAEREAVLSGEEAEHGVVGQGDVIGSEEEFSPVAGGQHQDFFDSFGSREGGQGFVRRISLIQKRSRIAMSAVR